MDSITIYRNLCESRKSLVDQYGHKSGLHKHHIVPRHSGGTDDEDNFTYLTPREHVIAHYLLWRIYKNPNDLRSMKMLGAKLSTKQRVATGEFCRDNNIGMFSEKYKNNKELQSSRCKRSAATQKLNKSGTFDPEYRKQWAAKAGKAGGTVQYINKLGIHNPEHRKEYASLGGKSHTGKKCMYKIGDNTFKRIPPEEVEKYLSEGYVFGSPHKPWNSKKSSP